jgi:hypothetical protein
VTQLDQWLVRTHQNQLTGPFPKDEVLRLIREGALGLQDEVCQANHYWITLHEREEVMAQLGIEPPIRRRRKSDAKPGEDDEITETETETANVFTDAAEAPGNSSVMMTRRGAAVSGEAESAHFAAMAAVPAASPSAVSPNISVRGQVERPQIWKGVAVVLSGLVIALVYMVIDILRR